MLENVLQLVVVLIVFVLVLFAAFYSTKWSDEGLDYFFDAVGGRAVRFEK